MTGQNEGGTSWRRWKGKKKGERRLLEYMIAERKQKGLEGERG